MAYDPAQAGDPAFVAAFEADFAEKVNGSPATPELAARFGLAGRQRCIDEFSWAKIAQETVDVYEAAIAAHAARWQRREAARRGDPAMDRPVGGFFGGRLSRRPP